MVTEVGPEVTKFKPGDRVFYARGLGSQVALKLFRAAFSTFRMGFKPFLVVFRWFWMVLG